MRLSIQIESVSVLDFIVGAHPLQLLTIGDFVRSNEKAAVVAKVGNVAVRTARSQGVSMGDLSMREHTFNLAA